MGNCCRANTKKLMNKTVTKELHKTERTADAYLILLIKILVKTFMRIFHEMQLPDTLNAWSNSEAVQNAATGNCITQEHDGMKHPAVYAPRKTVTG